MVLPSVNIFSKNLFWLCILFNLHAEGILLFRRLNFAEDYHQNLESAILLMISVVRFAVRFGFGLMRILTLQISRQCQPVC